MDEVNCEVPGCDDIARHMFKHSCGYLEVCKTHLDEKEVWRMNEIDRRNEYALRQAARWNHPSARGLWSSR